MTVTSPDRLFDAVAANTTSAVIDTNTHSGIKVFRVAPSSSFAGSLTVQGQQNGDGDTWQRVRYWTNRPPSTDVEGPSSDVLYPAPSDYLLLFVVDPWPAMRLVATRQGGSLTVDFFSELNRDFASLLLGSSSSVVIADTVTGDTLSITPGGGITVVSGDPNDAHVTAHLWSAEGPLSTENALRVAQDGPWEVTPSGSWTQPGYAGPLVLQHVNTLNTGDGVLYTTPGMTYVLADVTIATTATITWEGRLQDGTWTSLIAGNVATGATGTTATATGLYFVPVGGLSQMRARISAWTSGAVNVRSRGFQGSPPYTLALLPQTLAGEDQTFGRLKTEEGYSLTSITTQTTTTVKSGAGLVQRLIIPTQVASATVKVYDNTAGSGTVIVDTITLPATLLGEGPLIVEIGYAFGTGLTVVTAGATMAVDVVYA